LIVGTYPTGRPRKTSPRRRVISLPGQIGMTVSQLRDRQAEICPHAIWDGRAATRALRDAGARSPFLRWLECLACHIRRRSRGSETQARITRSIQHTLCRNDQLWAEKLRPLPGVLFNQKSSKYPERVDHSDWKAGSRSAFWSKVTVCEQPTLAPSARPQRHQQPQPRSSPQLSPVAAEA
jgi:hypothetical protein